MISVYVACFGFMNEMQDYIEEFNFIMQRKINLTCQGKKNNHENRMLFIVNDVVRDRLR